MKGTLMAKTSQKSKRGALLQIDTVQRGRLQDSVSAILAVVKASNDVDVQKAALSTLSALAPSAPTTISHCTFTG